MITELKSIPKSEESTLINNARKDFTEFGLFEAFNHFGKTIVFINDTLEPERIRKNLAFLNPNFKVLFIEEPSEIYNFSSPNAFLMAEKLQNVRNLLFKKYDFIIIDYKILLRKFPDKVFFEDVKKIVVQEKFGHSKLVQELFRFGFNRCETVFEFGEFAVRGFLIDIGTLDGFFRIEFDGETVVAISKFNTETQRKELSSHESSIEIGFIKDAVITESAMQGCKDRCFKLGVEDRGKMLAEIMDFGRLSLHNFLPLFFDKLEDIFSFLPEKKVIIKNSSLTSKLEALFEEFVNLESLYQKQGRQILPIPLLLNDLNEINNKF